MKDRGGRIINFGSGAGIRGQAGSAHYSASKGAVMAWTRTVAQEWAKYRHHRQLGRAGDLDADVRRLARAHDPIRSA